MNESTPSLGYNDIIIYKDSIYAVGAKGRIDLISPFGENKVLIEDDELVLNCAETDRTILIAAGNNGTILYSEDGDNFNYSKSNTDKNIYGMAYKFGEFIAGSENGLLLFSKDGKSWNEMQTTAKGNIISLSSNDKICIGITDESEIIKSVNGKDWQVQDYNKEYEGFNKFTIFRKILAIDNSIIIIGLYQDGSPSILISTLGNVWAERIPFYYDEEGDTKYLSSKPNDVTFEPYSDQFIVACDNGELLSLPSCSRCNKYLKISDDNLKAIISINNELVITGDNYSISYYKL